MRDSKASVKALASLINKRAGASAANIAGVYGKLAGDLGQYRATEQDIYDRARANVGADQTSGAAALAKATGDVGGTLASNLATSGPTGVDASAYQGDVAGITSRASARGQGNLGELALRQASAENYAAQLPQFARLAGAQALQVSEAGRRRDIAELSAQAQSQLARSLENRRRLEYEKAVAARGLGVDYAKIDAQQRTAAAAERGRNQRAAAANASREAIASARVTEQNRHNKIMEGIDTSTAAGRAAARRETARHNRVTENIKKRKDKWTRNHPGAGKGKGGKSKLPH